jgi:hypothetical protein
MGVKMSEKIESRSRKEKVERILKEIEWGAYEDIEYLEQILREMPRAIKHNLLVEKVCSRVEILDLKLEKQYIVVKFSCDGESYTTLWEWGVLCTYSASLERIE